MFYQFWLILTSSETALGTAPQTAWRKECSSAGTARHKWTSAQQWIAHHLIREDHLDRHLMVLSHNPQDSRFQPDSKYVLSWLYSTVSEMPLTTPGKSSTDSLTKRVLIRWGNSTQPQHRDEQPDNQHKPPWLRLTAAVVCLSRGISFDPEPNDLNFQSFRVWVTLLYQWQPYLSSLRPSQGAT